MTLECFSSQMQTRTAVVANPLLRHGTKRQRRSGMTSNKTRWNFTVHFASALLLLCGQFARAAENSSVVEGTVQDASGKPVTGAFVKLKNNERHLEFMVISQGQGHYAASNL